MKKQGFWRMFVLFVFLIIVIYYSWLLYSTDWSYSLAGLPSNILMLISGLLGLFIFFPRKDKGK
jgi:hypothetical protein